MDYDLILHNSMNYNNYIIIEMQWVVDCRWNLFKILLKCLFNRLNANLNHYQISPLVMVSFPKQTTTPPTPQLI